MLAHTLPGTRGIGTASTTTANNPGQSALALPNVHFNITKKEGWTPGNGFKAWQRRLRNGYKISLFKDELTAAKLADTNLLVFGAPKEKFTVAEFGALKAYMERGGSILYLGSEGGDASSSSETNFNYLLEEYGIMVNADAVARTVFHKYFHPKEVYVTNGVLNREINRAAGKRVNGVGGAGSGGGVVDLPASDGPGKFNPTHLTFIYPFGATLNVQKPAIPILSSGSVSYPLNRPVGAVYSHPNSGGKLVVVGAAQMFSDSYLEKEENAKLLDVLLQFCTSDKIVLNSIDASEPDISDYHYLPSTAALSSTLRSCLQESEELPKDFTSMFDMDLFCFDTTLIPAAVKAYAELGVRKESLTLIQPQFETPLPPLRPATFPPLPTDLPPPSLELFDLDDSFASDRVRLAQLTNKCTDDDLEYYVRECGRILGVVDRLDEGKRDAKHVLEFVFRSVVNWKKLDHV
ncbi:Intraflagellar transport protein 52 [Geranomyces variabilis]|nr:Intraflagellar transport protein 52 [Geranomyces variabilis]